MPAVKFDRVNVDQDVSIQLPERMKNGLGYLAKFDPVEIQLPAMKLPWKCRPQPPMSGNGPHTCKLALAFDAKWDELDNNGDQKAVYQMFRDVDKIALDYILAHKSEFFPATKKAPSDQLLREELFHKSIKESTDYAPTFQAKVDFRAVQNQLNGFDRSSSQEPPAKKHQYDEPEQEFELRIGCFNKEGNEVSPSIGLEKGNRAIAVIYPQHIWQVNSRCGITWKVPRVMVTSMETTSTSFDFDVDKTEDSQNE